MEGNKIQINTEKAEGEDFVCAILGRGDFLAHDLGLERGSVVKLCHIKIILTS